MSGRKTMTDIQEATRDVKREAGDLIRAIDTAISDVGSAQSSETMDMCMNNTAISMMSTMNSNRASFSLDDVQSALRDFKRALDTLGECKPDASGLQLNATVNDTMDSILDISRGDGFDFTSMSNVFNLSSARSDLESLRTKVQEVERKATRALQP
jgi:hypothetical protein